MDVDRRSTRAYCLEDSLWKRLWPCSNTEYMLLLLIDNVDDIGLDIIHSVSSLIKFQRNMLPLN